MSAVEELQPNQVILGERNYESATALILGRAGRELRIFDPNLGRGGYQSLKVHDLLKQFLTADRQNRLTIIMHDSQFLTSQCPRLIHLLRQYAHAMTICLTEGRAQAAQDAFVLADEGDYLHRFHVDHARFKFMLDDKVAAKPLHERFGQLLEASHVRLSAVSLGL
jgi:hypothetical protein